MGLLVNGQWSSAAYSSDKHGHFVRADTQFRNWITADGATGFTPEAGRYHLYVSYACPWAHRTVIMRKLKGLEGVVTLSVVDPHMGDSGWHFSDGPGCTPDTVNGASHLSEVYLKARADYTGYVTVPVLWDRKNETIVNNESREIMRMFDTVFAGLGDDTCDYCPPALRLHIDATIDALYSPINNGVYRSGFAKTQHAYEQAAKALFDALDHWEQRLAQQRFLCGHAITEADWCFFTTLVRFDTVYYSHFKCNLHRIVDYPNTWNYLKELYQHPGIAETCHFDHIKTHYYWSHESINPSRIVPIGPAIEFNEPHDRNRFTLKT